MDPDFIVEDLDRVLPYIRARRDLDRTLFGAKPWIRMFFPESPMVLRIVDHPEGDTDLVLFIQFSGSAEEAFERMKQLDEAWTYRCGMSEDFHMNVEFV